ncbi:hypothetical protein M422DRAFT_236826 [Sphaerobolus stellatus SS14]|uniref:Phosphatidylinositol N-acetylglucosaminyltransferase n=1 Tax=Sphaerobolus stellatus (strain SS14) TaxID=990650 RepID=A0A0C9UK29_SPHS4|nr:hypothetical protein M422DRAFT_236826 [Sphaerobolus stellatus SS14]
MSTEITWEKVLWKRQPYPDNYVPESFLSELRRNTNFSPYTYSAVILASCMIAQHLSALFIFLAVFARLYNETLDPRLLVGLTICCNLLGYILGELLESQSQTSRVETRAKMLKSIIFIVVALVILSPGLRTLTAATSSDSIWAISACLFILNTLLADYEATPPDKLYTTRLSSASVISINAAVFSSVVLASRLSTNNAVFALTLFSFHLFALFPFIRLRLQAYPSIIRIGFTTFMITLSLYLIASLSVFVVSLLILGYILVLFISPAILVWAQGHKNEIRGPWDVAVPHLR